MASIPGHITSEVVIIGCHRDGLFSFAIFICGFLLKALEQHGLWVPPILQAEQSLSTKLYVASVHY